MKPVMKASPAPVVSTMSRSATGQAAQVMTSRAAGVYRGGVGGREGWDVEARKEGRVGTVDAPRKQDAPPVLGQVNGAVDVASGNDDVPAPSPSSLSPPPRSAARPITMLPLAPSVVQTILAWPPSMPSSAAIPSSTVPLPVKALGKCALVTR